MIFTGPVTFTGPITVNAVDPDQITQPILAAMAANQGALVTDIHDELNEALQPVLDAVDALDTDLARELADFSASLSPKLTQDEKDRFAGLASRLVAFTASIDAADPAPVVEPTA